MSGAFDITEITALVVDANFYYRKTAHGVLRLAGIRKVLTAETVEEALDLIQRLKPNVMLTEWMPGPLGELEFIRQVRQGEDIPNRAMPILVLSSRRRQLDVEAARAAGADGYLMKPVSAASVAIKIANVVGRPRPFIATATYSGPCRRRKRTPAYAGPFRRLTDLHAERTASDMDEDVRAALRRARVAALTRDALALKTDDPAGARAVYASSLELRAMAEEIADAALSLGANELVRYLEAAGVTDRLDPEAVRTHVQALFQLAHLPSVLTKEREDLAVSLRTMVDKKLKPAA
ncbi:MAG: response regulator [Hyphomonadaceae bacterium]|nr:response regulator [Hyphomonadaceae bacterium]